MIEKSAGKDKTRKSSQGELFAQAAPPEKVSESDQSNKMEADSPELQQEIETKTKIKGLVDDVGKIQELMFSLQTAADEENPWLITFADLMSLLMGFFLLLFAISQVDLVRFREIAQSVSSALGGKQVIFVAEKGVPVTAPGEVTIKTGEPDNSQTQEYANQLRQDLRQEIETQKIGLEEEGRMIVIHILQDGSFSEGSADLNPEFLATARKIRNVLTEIPGALTIAGHTDDRPIIKGPFRSNWELSAARAYSVMHELLKDNVLPGSRFVIIGHADTKPREPNNSPANRAKNRRVEIIIDQRNIE